MTSHERDWRNRAAVSDGKLSGYLLSEEHGVGRFKARFLKSHGFDSARPDELRAALLAHVRQASTWSQVANAYGLKYVVVAPLPSPDGRDPLVRSVWFEEGEGSEVLFVTVYPRRSRG